METSKMSVSSLGLENLQKQKYEEMWKKEQQKIVWYFVLDS